MILDSAPMRAKRHTSAFDGTLRVGPALGPVVVAEVVATLPRNGLEALQTGNANALDHDPLSLVTKMIEFEWQIKGQGFNEA